MVRTVCSIQTRSNNIHERQVRGCFTAVHPITENKLLPSNDQSLWTQEQQRWTWDNSLGILVPFCWVPFWRYRSYVSFQTQVEVASLWSAVSFFPGHVSQVSSWRAPGTCSDFVLGTSAAASSGKFCWIYSNIYRHLLHSQLNVPMLNICKVFLFHGELCVFWKGALT